MELQTLHEQFCLESKVIRNCSKATIKWYENAFKRYLKYHGNAMDNVADINSENLRSFLFYGRLECDWTADTFLNYYKGLKAFLKWCVKQGYFEVNPIEKIEKPRLEKKLPKRITKQDALLVLDHAFNGKWPYRFLRYRNRAVFGLMIYAGLRANELLSLKLGDVDLSNNIISINCGKGGKDRVIPICSKLHVFIDAYLKDRSRLNKDSVYLFTSLQGDSKFTYDGLRKVVTEIKKRSGVKFSCHRLRHTFATMMIEGGCDLFTLSKILGHSDIKTTTIYLSASVKHMQEQIVKHPLN